MAGGGQGGQGGGFGGRQGGFGGAQPGPVGTGEYTGDMSGRLGQPAPGGGLVGGRGGATPGGYLNSLPPPVGLPPGLAGTMGGTGSGPGGLGTAYLGMPGGMPFMGGSRNAPFMGRFSRLGEMGVQDRMYRDLTPFATANPITGPTGAGGYSGTAQSMNSGGVAYANGGSTRFRRFTPTRTLPRANTTNVVDSTAKSGTAPQSFSDWYASFYQPKNPQEAYNLTLAMAQSPQYAAYYNSLSPATQAYMQPPLNPGSGTNRNISDTTNTSNWNYLASQAQHSYEQFGGKDPFTGRMYGEPPTISTGPQHLGELDDSGNLIRYATVTSSGFVLPRRGTPFGIGSGIATGGDRTGGGGTGGGGTGGGGTGGGGTGGGGTGGGGTGGGGTGGGGTGVGGTGVNFGGGFGQTNPYAPPPTYNAPEFPNLAFGYPFIPERLKALRAQQGIVPGGGGIPTTPPAVSTKAAKAGGIMSLVRRKR